MNFKYWTLLAGFYALSIKDVLALTKVKHKDYLKNPKKAKKQLIKNKPYGNDTMLLIDILELFEKISKIVHKNKSKLIDTAKEIDTVLNKILDMNQDEEYILPVVALYLAKKLPNDSLDAKLIQTKAERVYFKLIESLEKDQANRKSIRNSNLIGELAEQYIIKNKQINFSIRKNTTKWGSKYNG